MPIPARLPAAAPAPLSPPASCYELRLPALRRPLPRYAAVASRHLRPCVPGAPVPPCSHLICRFRRFRPAARRSSQPIAADSPRPLRIRPCVPLAARGLTHPAAASAPSVGPSARSCRPAPRPRSALLETPSACMQLSPVRSLLLTHVVVPTYLCPSRHALCGAYLTTYVSPVCRGGGRCASSNGAAFATVSFAWFA